MSMFTYIYFQKGRQMAHTPRKFNVLKNLCIIFIFGLVIIDSVALPMPCTLIIQGVLELYGSTVCIPNMRNHCGLRFYSEIST